MNKVVVTGAAHGLGRAFVSYYLSNGASVLALDRDMEALAVLKKDAASPRLLTHGIDVAQPAAFDEVSTLIRKRWTQPDVWINNAGIAGTGAFLDTSAEDFDRVLAVNLLGTIHGTRAALKLMHAPERGTIVNMSSASAEVPAPFMSSYVASKAGVTGFTRSLREELEQSHSPIRLVLVSPGFVKTRILDASADFPFPTWLRSSLPTPEAVVKRIVQGIERGKDEIQPTWNGQLITTCHRVAPDTTLRVSRLLIARDWKQALGLTAIRNDHPPK